MRKALLVMCVLALPCTLLAQANQASWTILSGLHAGQSIQVIDTSSKKHSGTFMSVSDTAISLQVAAGEQSIQKQDVRSVKLLSAKRRHNTVTGLVVGGIAGAGVGAAIGAATYKGCTQQSFCVDILSRGELAGIGAAAGFAGGAITGVIIGSMLASHTTLYNASSH